MPSERWRQLSRHRALQTPAFVLGAAVLLVVAAMALAAPVITPYDPIEQNLRAILLPPSSEHWLGTDHLGRDVWTRIVYAARVDLSIAIGAVVTPFLAGSALGVLAGYYGGWVDALVTSVGDLVMGFPYYVLIIALVFSLGAGIGSIFVAIGLVSWVPYARITRNETLSVKSREYVLAARTAGLGDRRILLWHVGPNVITQPIVYSTSQIVNVMVGIVTLSYFGLGVPPPTPDWGAMIAAGQAYMTTQWHLATAPGLAVIIVGLGLALLGDGLAELLDPE